MAQRILERGDDGRPVYERPGLAVCPWCGRQRKALVTETDNRRICGECELLVIHGFYRVRVA